MRKAMTYQMAPDVFACVTGRHCMFLDLHQDRYLSVQRTVMDALAPHIHGWQLPSASLPRTAVHDGEIMQLAAHLVAAGILLPCGARTHTPAIPPCSAAQDFTTLPSQGNAAGFPPRKLRIVAALIHADYLLHHVVLWRIVRHIPSMASTLPKAGGGDSLMTAHALTNSFRQARPWYPRNYLCLFDSLALMLFLLRSGIRAQWVFGVREDPFGAHCWIQCGPLVLNEYLDRTGLYTPIMMV